MASAPRLPKHLRAALGDDAGAELVTIIDEIRTERRHAEALHREQLARFDQRFDQLERRFDSVENRMGTLETRMGTLETRMGTLETRMGTLETRMGTLETRMGALDVKLGDVKADLMKWSFVFWVGAVAAIAALAGVLE